MREDICTIPISEVFEPKEGCPICRMRDTLENRVTEYITGAAMMEPDIREVTNVQGFCYPHFSMMLKLSLIHICLHAFHTADAAHLAKLAGNAALIAVGTPYHGLRL